MNRTRAEHLLDAAAPFVVGAAVLTAAAGSSIQRQLFHAGQAARWALLAALFVLAMVRLAVRTHRLWFPGRTAFLLASFCGLALVSAAWSVNRRATLDRAIAQPVVIVSLVVLAACVRGRPRLAPRLLDGVLAAAALLTVGGFIYWLVDPSRAAEAATVQYPARYRGLGENPNTVPLLLAIAMPIALWRCLVARALSQRGACAFLVLAFAASVSASGSRGGLVAGFFGLFIVAGLAPMAARTRLLVVACVVAVLVVAAWAMTIPKALTTSPSVPVAVAVDRHDADRVLPLSEEIGNPWWTHRTGGIHRTLFDTSVRVRALRGAVDRAFARPLLGYGFGAEQWAFVNRYYGFSSQNPENGYVGILLQLGIAGLALWLAVIVACVGPSLRAVRRAQPWVLGAVGAAAGALVVAVGQSYFHGPGGIAYVALWTVLLLSAVGAGAVVGERP